MSSQIPWCLGAMLVAQNYPVCSIACHGLADAWGTLGATNTYSYFTIGGTNKYFVAGNY
ncbi:MAG: hypothetical protein QM642_05065 [Edaphocola sp.]